MVCEVHCTHITFTQWGGISHDIKPFMQEGYATTNNCGVHTHLLIRWIAFIIMTTPHCTTLYHDMVWLGMAENKSEAIFLHLKMSIIGQHTSSHETYIACISLVRHMHHLMDTWIVFSSFIRQCHIWWDKGTFPYIDLHDDIQVYCLFG